MNHLLLLIINSISAVMFPFRAVSKVFIGWMHWPFEFYAYFYGLFFLELRVVIDVYECEIRKILKLFY